MQIKFRFIRPWMLTISTSPPLKKQMQHFNSEWVHTAFARHVQVFISLTVRTAFNVGVIMNVIPILQVKNRHRELEQLAQGNTAGRWVQTQAV